LVVSGLTAGYGGVPIVNDINIGLRPYEVVAIVGPNGAGKSTLLKALTGQLQPVAGMVTLGDDDISGFSGDRLTRMGVGYVPQTRDVFAPLTVAENLQMGGYLLSKSQVAAHVEMVLSKVPTLRPLMDRSAHSLSGGERKLLAIGRCLMLEPRVLLLDEPTASLSPKLARMVLRSYVRTLADSGTAVLLVEQRVQDALETANWAHVMVGGQIHISAPASELLERQDLGEIFLGVVK
jgi:ABC-type branched-subunit amino acid transport system ATPase component